MVRCAAAVRICPVGSDRFVRCLSMCGARLVGGSGEGDVWVWDRETLALVGRAREGCGVRALAEGDAGEVWGCVGKEVVVWGQDD